LDVSYIHVVAGVLEMSRVGTSICRDLGGYAIKYVLLQRVRPRDAPKAANLRDQREMRENDLFPHVYACQFQIQCSEKLVAPEQQKKLSRKTKGCVAPAIIPADVTISGQAGKQTISVDL